MNQGFRSTPRIASTAKPATSRTRPRTSIGSHPKAAEAPITRTCNIFTGVTLAALALAPRQPWRGFPFRAIRPGLCPGARRGDERRSCRAAELFAELAEAQARPGRPRAKGARRSDRRGEDRPFAHLARSSRRPSCRAMRGSCWSPTKSGIAVPTGRSVAGGERRHRRPHLPPPLSPHGTPPSAAMQTRRSRRSTCPTIRCWRRSRPNSERCSSSNSAAPADAEPFARRAIGARRAREKRLRLALADGFLAAGDKARAAIMLDGMGAGDAPAKARLAAGKPSGAAIDNLPEGFVEKPSPFAGDIARLHRARRRSGWSRSRAMPTPQNSSATALLALLLHGQDRTTKRWRCWRRSRRATR